MTLRSVRLVGLALAVCALAGACTSAESGASRLSASSSPSLSAPSPTPSASPTASASASSSPSPASPSPSPSPTVAALTGLPPASPAAYDRPVLAVKLDNSSAARPQQGLGEADIVFEELVEGGMTRFAALYNSTLPEQVGPVRSAREVDAKVFPAFSPLLVISGAAEPTLAKVRDAGLPVIRERGTGEQAFVRSPQRAVPHNLFVRLPAVAELAGSSPTTQQPPAARPWPLAADPPDGGRTVPSAALRFSPQSSARWSWDPAQAKWLRSQKGEPHTSADGARVQAATVVIVRVPVTVPGGNDPAGNPIPSLAVIGSGKATVLRDGRAYEARWRKGAADKHLQWLDPRGEPLPLSPGTTWVEFVGDGGSVSLQRAPGQSESG